MSSYKQAYEKLLMDLSCLVSEMRDTACYLSDCNHTVQANSVQAETIRYCMRRIDDIAEAQEAIDEDIP